MKVHRRYHHRRRHHQPHLPRQQPCATRVRQQAEADLQRIAIVDQPGNMTGNRALQIAGGPRGELWQRVRGLDHMIDIARLMPLTYAVVMFLVFFGLGAIYLDIANPLDF